MWNAVRIAAREAAVMAAGAAVPVARLVGRTAGTAARVSEDVVQLSGVAVSRLVRPVSLAGAEAVLPVAQRGLVEAGAVSRLAAGAGSASRVTGELGDAAATLAAGGKNPVLLVPGFASTDECLKAIGSHLEAQGHRVFSINLYPNLASAETQAAKVARAVDWIRSSTGAAKVDLVGHSFGGLINRQFVERMGGSQVVDRVVTIGTPHFGTRLASLGVGGAAQDMRVGSRFLRQLNAVPRPAGVRYSSIWTNSDQVILPNHSAILPGSRVYPAVPNAAHVSILFDNATLQHVGHALAH